MSAGAGIKIEGDASGFISATEQSAAAAKKMAADLNGAIGSSTGGAVKGLKGMDQEGRKACKRLNAGLLNTSATITAVKAGIDGMRAGWAKFSEWLGSGDDVEKVTRRLEAFTGGAASAAKGAREVVEFADTPPFGLEETQKAAQLLLGVNVRSSELKSTLEALGNVAAGGGMSLSNLAVRLSVAFQSGKVGMRDLRPLMESGIDVMGVLAQRTGKTRAELGKMLTTGQLGFKDLMGALMSMGSEGGQFAGAMAENTQDLGNRVEALKGKVGALGRELAEPVTSGVKDAMDEIGASWSGQEAEVTKGLKRYGSLLGDIVRQAAPIVSVVGSGMAKLATGTGLVERLLRAGIMAWGAWKVAGMVAGSSAGQAVKAAAMALRTDYNNELRLASGHTKRFDAAVRASGMSARRAWQGVGAGILSSLKGPAIMAAITAITAATVELYRASREASGVVSKEEQDQKKNLRRDNDDFDKRIWKQAGEASSKHDVHAVIDEYDAEIERLKRLSEDQEDPLGRYTVAIDDRVFALMGERKELLKVAEASAKAAQAREREARSGQQSMEARKKSLEEIRKIEEELLSIDYDRAEAERERQRSGMGLEARKKDLLGSYGDTEGIRKAIEEQRALLSGSDAVDGTLNLEGVESKIKSLYDLLGKVEEVDREITQRNKEWERAERQHQQQAALLRAEIHGEREKLRLLKEQAHVRELQSQYESSGMSKARAGAAAQETIALEKNRDRAAAGRAYREQVALLKAQAAGNKAEEERLKMAARMKEIYNQQRDMGVDKGVAAGRARRIAGLEDQAERQKNRKKEGNGPIADSLAQVGGGGRSMMGSMPQLTEARKQTTLLQQIVKNTAGGRQGDLRTEAVMGY